MKKSLLLIAMSVAMVASASKTTAAESPWGYSLNHVSMSKYYGTIVGGIFYDGPMSFTSVTASRADAIGATRFGFCFGQKLDSLSFDKDGGNEYDISFGKSATLGSPEFPVNVDYCLTYLVVHNLRQMKDDVVSNAIRIDLPKVPFAKPYVVVTRFDKLGTTGSGWFVYGGVERSDQVGVMNGKPVMLGLEYRAGYSTALFGTKPGMAYHRLTVSLTAELSKGWVITPAIVGQTSGHGQPVGYAFESGSRLFASLNISKQL